MGLGAAHADHPSDLSSSPDRSAIASESRSGVYFSCRIDDFLRSQKRHEQLQGYRRLFLTQTGSREPWSTLPYGLVSRRLWIGGTPQRDDHDRIHRQSAAGPARQGLTDAGDLRHRVLPSATSNGGPATARTLDLQIAGPRGGPRVFPSLYPSTRRPALRTSAGARSSLRDPPMLLPLAPPPRTLYPSCSNSVHCLQDSPGPVAPPRTCPFSSRRTGHRTRLRPLARVQPEAWQ